LAMRSNERVDVDSQPTKSGVTNLNALHSPAFAGFAAGGEVIDIEQARARRQLYERASRLSGRERAILSELAQGQATEEIAQELFLSPHTVRSHVKAAMRKLDARTRAHAVAIALTTGTIEAV
jgi:DNA-binding CsgD family transcriptional regulator